MTKGYSLRFNETFFARSDGDNVDDGSTMMTQSYQNLVFANYKEACRRKDLELLHLLAKLPCIKDVAHENLCGEYHQPEDLQITPSSQ